ncbi:MAG TPA: hypothetical protein VF950_30195 [Planctomycetota bacterium]
MKSLLLAVLLASPSPELVVTYTSPGKGFLSLAVYDEQGTLVRTLLSAQAVEAGPGSTSWDATTDLGVPVKAGRYQARGVFFAEPPRTDWRCTVGKSGNPPYPTADGRGGWGGNLGYASGICANDKTIVMSWACVEDHQITGVQEMDADGNVQRRYHTFYPWDQRSASAMDERNLYLGIYDHGKGLELAEYKLGEPKGRILAKLPVKPVKTPTGRWAHRAFSMIDGLALTPDRIFASVATTGELFAIERTSGKILKQASLKAPYGLAVRDGKLHVVSDGQVLRYTLDLAPDGVAVSKGVLVAPGALVAHPDGRLFVGDSGTRAAIDLEFEAGSKQIVAFSKDGKEIGRVGAKGGAPRSGRFVSERLGDIYALCLSPDKKALFVQDVATGFNRTSRWSLDGKLEKEWFGRKLECFSDRVNLDRPEEIVKVGGAFDDVLTAQAWTVDYVAGTWKPAWRYTMPYAQNWQNEVVVGYGHGGNPLREPDGKVLPWPIFSYGDEGGLRSWKGRHYMLSGEGVIFTYGPDQAPKPVAMAFSHRAERKGEKIQTYYDQGPNTWFTWADANADGRVQIGETDVVENPPLLADAPRLWTLQWAGDGLDLLIHIFTRTKGPAKEMTRLARLPLKELRPDGVPVYDWRQLKLLDPGLAYPSLDGGAGDKPVGHVSAIEFRSDEKSLYTIIDPGCAKPLRLPGIDGEGWWASRNWRKKIARFDKATGRCLWAVGRRAAGAAKAGQMYNPTSVAGVVDDAVFASDAMGVIWVWDTDGRYIGRLYNGPDDRKLDSNQMNIELMRANVLRNPKDGKIYAVTNDTGVQVHEVILPRRTPVAGAAVVVTEAVAAAAKPWDPEGVTPGARPSGQALRAAGPVTVNGDLDGREGWHAKGVEPLLVLLEGERLATVRVLYDASTLYLSYEVASPREPLNPGTELPISPFVSGAYVDFSIAPEWSRPQREAPAAGDVRVILARITGSPPSFFQSGYWQVRPGGQGGQTVTSPAASVRIDQIMEVPGLKQAWKLKGMHDRTKSFLYTVEAAVPLASIGITGDPAGRTIGFDASVAFANEGGDRRERAAHWAGETEAAVVDRPGSIRLLPRTWGSLTFGR